MSAADLWGERVQCEEASSLDAWNTAWTEAMHFVGDAFETLEHANAHDDGFALGSVFCGVYRVLGGCPLDDRDLLTDVTRANERARSSRERAHVEALNQLAAGEFTAAAKGWDAIDGFDFAAVRFAHDVYLHVGDAPRRLHSSERAMGRWSESDPWWSFVAGQHSFSLEEAGFLDEAESLGWRALDLDPMDLWALHSLAHVYETVGDSAASLAMLRARQDVWATQDQLSVHVWWHLALRLIAERAFDDALDIHDELRPSATTPFRMCDLISLLWRLELQGVDVGDRWGPLADAFAARPEHHTSGFLDLHGAMVFSRVPEHPSAPTFFEGVVDMHRSGRSENDHTFREVVAPLVDAFRVGESDPSRAAALLDQTDRFRHRIGGSVAQRDIVDLTRSALTSTITENP